LYSTRFPLVESNPPFRSPESILGELVGLFIKLLVDMMKARIFYIRLLGIVNVLVKKVLY
jgi:hypothetical protein